MPQFPSALFAYQDLVQISLNGSLTGLLCYHPELEKSVSLIDLPFELFPKLEILELTGARYAFNVCFLALWCGLGVLWFCPAISIYTGLSALLHGVIIWGAVKDITLSLKSGYLLFIGVWIKIIMEQVNGPDASIGQLIDSTVAIDAHLIGAVGGTLLSIPLAIKYLKNSD